MRCTALVLTINPLAPGTYTLENEAELLLTHNNHPPHITHFTKQTLLPACVACGDRQHVFPTPPCRYWLCSECGFCSERENRSQWARWMGSQTPCCGCPSRAPLWPRAIPAGVPRSELRPLRSKRSTATAINKHAQQYHTVGEDHMLCSCCAKVRVDKIVCMLWYCYILPAPLVQPERQRNVCDVRVSCIHFSLES